MSERRGQIGLSTNALIAIIVAVIVLGLVLAFVFSASSSTNAQLDDLTRALPDPIKATGNEPIIVSYPQSILIGETFGMKISVYNADENVVVAMTPGVDCTILNATEEKVNIDDIEPKKAKQFMLLETVFVTTTPGTYLCTVTADGGSVVLQKQIALNVVQN